MRLLCIAPYVPHAAIPHAGGAYLHRYLATAAQTEDVVLAAPATPSNAETVASGELPYDVHLLEPARVPLAALSTPALNARAALSPGWPVLAGMRSSPVLESLAGWSDLIDVEYGQLLPVVPVLRQWGPQAAVVSTEHDVVTQVFARRGQAAHGAVRLALAIQRRRIERREIRYLNSCDLVRVTSSKDEQLLRSMGLTARCLVTDFVGGGAPTRPFELGRSGVVAFTGALWRSENSQSVLWFVNQVWPKVITRVPTAQFLAVGAEPGPELTALNSRPGVTVQPWVPDLDKIYATAGVFVAPLVLGAGVKLKVFDAMRFGLPVVATTIGAEGIDDMAPSGAIAAVTNDPSAFADSVATLLITQDLRHATGKLASEWMASRPSFADSVADSLTVYRDLVDRRRPA